MSSMLINARRGDEIRVALIDNNKLVDLDIDRPGLEQRKSNIYKGVISSIEPSLGAVFVNYGAERHGFLPLKEISREYFMGQDIDMDNLPEIGNLLKVGQELVVQVEKDERGSKGAALTSYITLAGAYLVLMPNNPRGGGISRRIEGEEREQLKAKLDKLNVPDGMSVIVRTAGVSRDVEDLQWDLNQLMNYWDAIKQAAIAQRGPYLIHQESDVVTRAVRDYLRHDVSEIIVDEAGAFDRAKKCLEQLRPDFVERLKLYEEIVPLFSRFNIEQQIEAAYQREVRLPSGGSIVIDHTEALVSIDINSARATRGSNIEETALHTNVEAAKEIARQLRIRDIGGLIVIDFIDMTPTKNQREVENQLREALSMDRARVQIGRISRFGLLEMSRQRLGSSINRTDYVTCPRCQGKGTIRSVESTALAVIHQLLESAARLKSGRFYVQAPVDVSTVLINEKRHSMAQIERNFNVEIFVVPNPNYETPDFKIHHKETDGDVDSDIMSYELADKTSPDVDLPKDGKRRPKADIPVINAFLDEKQKHVPQPKRKKPGLISRVFTSLFGSEEEEAPKKRSHSGRGGRGGQNRGRGGQGRGRGGRGGQNRGRGGQGGRGSNRDGQGRGPNANRTRNAKPTDSDEKKERKPRNNEQRSNERGERTERTERGGNRRGGQGQGRGRGGQGNRGRGGQGGRGRGGQSNRGGQGGQRRERDGNSKPLTDMQSESLSIPQTMDNIGNVKEAPAPKKDMNVNVPAAAPKTEAAPKPAAPAPKPAPKAEPKPAFEDKRTPGTQGLASRSGVVSAPAADTSSND